MKAFLLVLALLFLAKTLSMAPPLPPVTSGSSLTKAAPPKIQIECFLDLICPFSAKMFGTLYEKVIPTLDEDISVTMHHVIQPWHPQGTMVHEAALAVKQVAPESYPAYVSAIYSAYTTTGKFKDEDTWNKTRLQIYDDLLEWIPDGVDKEAVKALLMPTWKGGNEGNAMTQDIKWACQFHRTRGVHVTPTVFVNGLEASVVSSSWTEEDWKKFLS
jgi:protein-disulfide isomerase